jgi:hypothetical protein
VRVQQFALVGAALAGAVALAACTSSVAGSAQPAPGQGPVTPAKSAADPCTLLSPDQLNSLSLAPKAAADPADLSHYVPASCRWYPTDDSQPPLYVRWSDGISLDDYLSGGTPLEKFDLGGLSWTRYPSLLGKSSCEIYVTLSPESFVNISSENDDDATKACDLAKAAAPLVASHLPGGAPASPGSGTPTTSPTTSPTAPSTSATG